MTFGTPITRGAAVSITNNTTLAVTLTGTVVVGRILIVSVTSFNIATVDGASNNHTQIVDSQGNIYNKVYERTNTVAGVTADGVTQSVWWSRITTELTTSHSVTVTFSANVTKKTMNLLEIPLTNDIDWTVIVEQTGFGDNTLTAAVSSLPSREYLFYYHGSAQTTDATKTAPTNFTERFDQRADATAPSVGNETATRVITATSESGAASGWTTTANTLQSVMVAFYEYQFIYSLNVFDPGILTEFVTVSEPYPPVDININLNIDTGYGSEFLELLNEFYLVDIFDTGYTTENIVISIEAEMDINIISEYGYTTEYIFFNTPILIPYYISDSGYFIADAETGDLSQFNSIGYIGDSTAEITSSVVFGGLYSYKFTLGYTSGRYVLASSPAISWTEGYSRVVIKVDSSFAHDVGSVDVLKMFNLIQAGSAELTAVSMSLNSSGIPYRWVLRGFGYTDEYDTNHFSLDKWHQIEIYYKKVGAGTCLHKIWIDGDLVYNKSTGTINQNIAGAQLGIQTSSNTSGGTEIVYYDNWILNQTGPIGLYVVNAIYDIAFVTEDIQIQVPLTGINIDLFDNSTIFEYIELINEFYLIDLFDITNTVESVEVINEFYLIDTFDNIFITELIILLNEFCFIDTFDISYVSEFISLFAGGDLNVTLYDLSNVLEAITLLNEFYLIEVFNFGYTTENIELYLEINSFIFDNVYMTESIDILLPYFVLDIQDFSTIVESIQLHEESYVDIYDFIYLTEFIQFDILLEFNIFDSPKASELIDASFDPTQIGVAESPSASEVLFFIWESFIDIQDYIYVSEYIEFQFSYYDIGVFDNSFITESLNIFSTEAGVISISIIEDGYISENIIFNVSLSDLFLFDIAYVLEDIQRNVEIFTDIFDISYILENINFLLFINLDIFDLGYITENVSVLVEEIGVTIISVFDNIYITELIFNEVDLFGINKFEQVFVSENIQLFTPWYILDVYDLIFVSEQVNLIAAEAGAISISIIEDGYIFENIFIQDLEILLFILDISYSLEEITFIWDASLINIYELAQSIEYIEFYLEVNIINIYDNIFINEYVEIEAPYQIIIEDYIYTSVDSNFLMISNIFLYNAIAYSEYIKVLLPGGKEIIESIYINNIIIKGIEIPSQEMIISLSINNILKQMIEIKDVNT